MMMMISSAEVLMGGRRLHTMFTSSSVSSSSSSSSSVLLMWILLVAGSFVSLVDSQCSGDSEGRGDASCVCNNETFSCTNAGLTQLPDDIPLSITLINVSWNSIATIEDNALAKFQKLEKIVLSDNQLGPSLSSEVFQNLPALEQLYLDGNSLTTLEEISSVPNLQNIDISRNPITCNEKLKWLASIQQVVGTCSNTDQSIADFIASLKSDPPKDTMNNSTDENDHSMEGHHPSATQIYTVSIVLPILLVAVVCTVFVAIIVYRNKQKEAKYNSSVRYSAVQKDRGGGRVYDDVTTEL